MITTSIFILLVLALVLFTVNQYLTDKTQDIIISSERGNTVVWLAIAAAIVVFFVTTFKALSFGFVR